MVSVETFKCVECQTGRFVIQEQAAIGLCLDCGATERTDIKQLHKIKETAVMHLKTGKIALADGRRLDAEETLLAGHREFEEVAHESSELLNELKGKLAECYAMMSDWPQAIHYTLERIELFKKIYDEQSTILCAEMCKLSDYQWELFDHAEKVEVEIGYGRTCLVTTSNALKLIEGRATQMDDQDNLVSRLKERLLFCYMFEQHLAGVLGNQTALQQPIDALVVPTTGDAQNETLATIANQAVACVARRSGVCSEIEPFDPFDI